MEMTVAHVAEWEYDPGAVYAVLIEGDYSASGSYDPEIDAFVPAFSVFYTVSCTLTDGSEIESGFTLEL